jgi:hypothetical protein
MGVAERVVDAQNVVVRMHLDPRKSTTQRREGRKGMSTKGFASLR